MKHINFIIACVALLGLFTACSEEDGTVGSLKNLKVSETYIAFPAEGGSTTINLTAKKDWTFDEQFIPEWLTISPLSGGAGEYSVTFTASEYEDSDSAELEILVGNLHYVSYYILQNVKDENGDEVLDEEGNNVTERVEKEILVGDDTQFINVAIGEEAEAEPVEIAWILSEGVVGKTYIVSGWCNSIANTTYGNWYMADDDGNRLYIYGTMTSGKYDWDSEGIDVGDYVTVKGPLSIYNGIYELVDVVVLEVVKSLISVKADAELIPKEGGEASVVLEVSGDGLSFSIPDEDKSWLSVSDVVTATDSTIVVFYAQPNTEGDRSTTVTFSTVSGGTTYTAEAVIEQEGSIVVATAAEIIEGEDGTRYQMYGYISEMKSTTYGNYNLTDFSGTVYVYGTLDADGNTKNFESLDINEGDLVTVVGPKTTYNETTVELVDVTVVEHTPVTAISIADFRELEDDSSTYYRLTGTVTQPDEDGTSFDLETNGRFALTDETGSVYIYNVSTGVNGESKQFGTLGVEEGDELTIICYKTSYNGLIEAGGSMYISHTSAN